MNAQKSFPSVAWVVGVGPSKGLGAALARRFARGGSTVVVTGRNNARLSPSPPKSAIPARTPSHWPVISAFLRK